MGVAAIWRQRAATAAASPGPRRARDIWTPGNAGAGSRHGEDCEDSSEPSQGFWRLATNDWHDQYPVNIIHDNMRMKEICTPQMTETDFSLTGSSQMWSRNNRLKE